MPMDEVSNMMVMVIKWKCFFFFVVFCFCDGISRIFCLNFFFLAVFIYKLIIIVCVVIINLYENQVLLTMTSFVKFLFKEFVVNDLVLCLNFHGMIDFLFEDIKSFESFGDNLSN